MTIRMADGYTVKASRVGKWFIVGFALATLALNSREIAGLVIYVI